MLNQIQTLAKVLRASNYSAKVWSKYGMNRIYVKGVCGVPNSSKLYVDFPSFDNEDWDGTIEGCLDYCVIMEKRKNGWIDQASEEVNELFGAIVDHHAELA